MLQYESLVDPSGLPEISVQSVSLRFLLLDVLKCVTNSVVSRTYDISVRFPVDAAIVNVPMLQFFLHLALL